MKKAFTLIELVIVITILAILSSIGTDIFDRVYMNYIQTKSLQKLELETGILIEQIAKRLENRIKPTLAVTTDKSTYKSLDQSNANWGNGTEIVWFAQSYETQRLQNDNERILGWSGFIDLENTKKDGDKIIIKTPGSNLNLKGSKNTLIVETIQNFNPSYGKLVVVFKGNETDVGNYYKIKNGGKSDYAHEITVKNDDEFAITVQKDKNGKDIPIKIYEQYWLSYAICAFRIQNANAKLKELRYIEFPFSNEKEGNLLTNNVSSINFKSTADNGVIVKLCLADPNFDLTPDEKDADEKRYLEVCKTKVVL